MEYTVEIKVDPDVVKEMDRLLDQEQIDFHNEKIAEDSTIESFTAIFPNGYEADIKVCAGQNNCFIDAVLFDEQGCERTCFSDHDELLGEYEFDVDDIKYKVLITEQ